MSEQILPKIQEIFDSCRDVKTGKKTADFCTTSKIFWPTLCNSLTMADLAGIWAIAASGGDGVDLDSKSFSEFFNGVARLKYPLAASQDFCKALTEELITVPTTSLRVETIPFDRILDREAIHELFKVDVSIKNSFLSFAGDSNVSVAGGLQWEEAKVLSLGLELGTITDYTEAYAISPDLITAEVTTSMSAPQEIFFSFLTFFITEHLRQRCTFLAKCILDNYPLKGKGSSSDASPQILLYPQFEMLLCLMALEVHQSKDLSSALQTAAPSSGGRIISGTTSSVEETSMSTIISEFLGKSKIVDHPNGEPRRFNKKAPSKPRAIDYNSSDESIDEPQSPLLSANCVDQYTGSLKHNRQAMLFRMQKLFDSVELYLREGNLTNGGPTQALASLIRNNRDQETLFNSKMRFASKPVVIGDSVPLPACPSPVEQLLHSALAHHNLGSFEETILFLDAAKREFLDLKNAAKDGSQDSVIELPINFEMYVLLSKGNLYRSCGEDERAMLCYIEGWDTSKEHQDKGADWEVIFINSIGVLAYYLVRYDIALMCFDRVVRYREQEYGSDSSDTATALNNEGCSLFGMNERGEARLRFERSWLVGSKALGHRAPRAIIMWQNLVKARRSSTAGTESRTQREEMKERVGLRPDSEKLLVGGTFAIKAIAPPLKLKKAKKKVGGKKKKAV